MSVFCTGVCSVQKKREVTTRDNGFASNGTSKLTLRVLVLHLYDASFVKDPRRPGQPQLCQPQGTGGRAPQASGTCSGSNKRARRTRRRLCSKEKFWAHEVCRQMLTRSHSYPLHFDSRSTGKNNIVSNTRKRVCVFVCDVCQVRCGVVCVWFAMCVRSRVRCMRSGVFALICLFF